MESRSYFFQCRPAIWDTRLPLVRSIAALLLGLQFLSTSHAEPTVASDSVTAQGAQASVLRFSDFFRFPIGPQGLEVSPVLQQASGKDVVLTGYMVRHERGNKPGKFFLTPRPVQMSEHADGDADDLPPATVLVTLAPEQAEWIVPHARGLIQVQGRLSVGRQEALDGRVTWVQLQLHPDATRGMSAFEFAAYLHSMQHQH